MTWTRVIIAATVLAAVTTFSGILHGRLSNRWGPSDASRELAARLVQFPQSVGDWTMSDEEELSDKVETMLQCSGYFNRNYVHNKSGAVVKIAVLLGPPGPMVVHRPEICYSSRKHEILEPTHKVRFGDDEFWALTLKSKDIDGGLLRVYYGWATANDQLWVAAGDWARLYYAAEPCLFKLQLACVPASETDDPGGDFLTALLPALQPYLSNTN